ncbi:Uncharacterized membrane protein YdjX, TVP38/TMEM64 family, SNARE-associated domain [Pseudobacteriovorax antillogorgiicola]|uniref:TVP38/TMEM64 family membrane protein n=2 Tax=Pseudobacteriovorax antillogorgiicola TaxID=1513793 RepID=A0A1Y6BU85_9BACT|nr:putative membrane protein YdjX (TVP38/TMEM64 family) [Pseudobacteriovorax antillogorgiicola]SMF28805.1 Uncharacterized membrane protein YdjX, TVP38/TMEM64 family, SNARE-associated domain [Pseudobacteriovorax antillogorgiicola]
MGDQNYSPHRFLILALLRPFFFTPIMVPAMIGGSNFGPLLATLLTAAATALSALVFYLPGYYLGKKLVRPWLMTNLPSTWSLIRSQDFKLIFITRWVPLFPFDLMSFLFGAANFHASRLVMFSFLGIIPEVWLFSNLASPSNQAIGNGFLQILAFSLITSLPLLGYEYVYRRRGTSLWHQLKRVYYEVFYEVQVNNEIKKKQVFTNQKPPVIILYGFFSSRRTLGVMERLMNVRGYQVMTFNLGGVLGTFFTRGIEETADFIDRKIRRQIQRHGFNKIYIVSHSKGGLVALWWILRMGGHKYCDHVITMGTPFKGSRLTYLALFTPLGFFWKDVWQMRPGSRFLRELHESPPQDKLTIYNIYSDRDGVATGTAGVFHHPSNVKLIPMHRYAHFEFLFKRAVADQLVAILNQAEKQRLEQESLQQPMQDRRRPRNGNLNEDDGNQGLA